MEFRVQKKSLDGEGNEIANVVLAGDVSALDQLNHRLQEAQASIDDLQTQVVQSAEVIKELASQNAQLVAQIESNRKAVTVLGVAVALAVIGVIVQAVVLFSA